MSRLLFSLDGVDVSIQNGPLYPPDHVLMVLGSNVAVLNVDLKMPDSSGLPRTDYQRVYVVIPPQATASQIAAIRATHDPLKHTIGYSYDDAGIGALSSKLAILYGVENRETEFRNWYAANYHGTQLEFRPLPLRQEAQP